METRQLFIAIVDISGYTSFLRRHKDDLVHAEEIIIDLMCLPEVAGYVSTRQDSFHRIPLLCSVEFAN